MYAIWFLKNTLFFPTHFERSLPPAVMVNFILWLRITFLTNNKSSWIQYERGVAYGSDEMKIISDRTIHRTTAKQSIFFCGLQTKLNSNHPKNIWQYSTEPSTKTNFNSFFWLTQTNHLFNYPKTTCVTEPNLMPNQTSTFAFLISQSKRAIYYSVLNDWKLHTTLDMMIRSAGTFHLLVLLRILLMNCSTRTIQADRWSATYQISLWTIWKLKISTKLVQIKTWHCVHNCVHLR